MMEKKSSMAFSDPVKGGDKAKWAILHPMSLAYLAKFPIGLLL